MILRLIWFLTFIGWHWKKKMEHSGRESEIKATFEMFGNVIKSQYRACFWSLIRSSTIANRRLNLVRACSKFDRRWSMVDDLIGDQKQARRRKDFQSNSGRIFDFDPNFYAKFSTICEKGSAILGTSKCSKIKKTATFWVATILFLFRTKNEKSTSRTRRSQREPFSLFK